MDHAVQCTVCLCLDQIGVIAHDGFVDRQVGRLMHEQIDDSGVWGMCAARFGGRVMWQVQLTPSSQVWVNSSRIRNESAPVSLVRSVNVINLGVWPRRHQLHE